MTGRFFVGLHQPHDAKHFDLACVSIRRLWKRKKPLGPACVLIDSGAFMELKLYGEYRESVETYAAVIHRLHTQGVVNIAGVVAQDYMCEAFMLERTGKTVAEHQRMTIERYDALAAALARLFPDGIPFPVMPVLQGFAPEEYAAHLAAYGDRLTPDMWVGVGSVCKRNGSPEQVGTVLQAIKALRPDLRLHGFGIKLTALAHPTVHRLLATADSQAWSYRARAEKRDPNDWREAAKFAERVGALFDRPRDPYIIDFFGMP